MKKTKKSEVIKRLNATFSEKRDARFLDEFNTIKEREYEKGIDTLSAKIRYVSHS